MLNTLANAARSRRYWLALLALAVLFEATALYFQYALDYGPCVLCIHVRMLVAGLMLVSLLGFALYRTRSGSIVAHLFSIVVLAGIVQRAYLLLGIERGFVEGECSVELGLPAWLPLDQWFPLMFQVHAACGYTPVMPMGVTMAELLLVSCGALLLFNLGLLLAMLFQTGARVAG
jgi:disulfide bond formation protein DsbB